MGNAKSTGGDGGGETTASAVAPKINAPEGKTNKKQNVKTSSSGKSDKTANVTDAKVKIQPLLPPSQREIIRFCLLNAKDDLGERIYRRVMEKREDFRNYALSLDDEQRATMPELLKQFIQDVVRLLLDGQDIEPACASFGERHVQLRCNGFKPDFFATTADAVATECIFLDGAVHSSTETLLAWSQLASAMFTAVRDGYYKELRRMRRLSTATSKSEDWSDKKEKEDTEKKEDAQSSR
jgi:hypothetical protein